MITADLVYITLASGSAVRTTLSPSGRAIPRARGEEWMGRVTNPEHWRLVAEPTCGCCGKPGVVQVQGGFLRCEKHIGRNPCCIDGCGKTFAHKGDADYDTTIMCGRCWRQAPKWMRDRESKIRRLAKRRGWTDQLCRIHDWAWHSCRRRIERARTADPVEVEASAAPPPAALVVELQRLGL